MDKLLAVLMLAPVAALLLVGHVYLRLERERAFARLYLKRLLRALGPWFTVLDSLLADAADYPSLKAAVLAPSKRPEEKAAPLNALQSLAAAAVAARVTEPEARTLGARLTETFEETADLQYDYNDAALRFDRLLDMLPYGTIGAWLGFRPLTKLQDRDLL